jgi:hypothetical protein
MVCQDSLHCLPSGLGVVGSLSYHVYNYMFDLLDLI